jgi:hypothetical protein
MVMKYRKFRLAKRVEYSGKRKHALKFTPRTSWMTALVKYKIYGREVG